MNIRSPRRKHTISQGPCGREVCIVDKAGRVDGRVGICSGFLHPLDQKLMRRFPGGGGVKHGFSLAAPTQCIPVSHVLFGCFRQLCFCSVLSELCSYLKKVGFDSRGNVYSRANGSVTKPFSFDFLPGSGPVRRALSKFAVLGLLPRPRKRFLAATPCRMDLAGVTRHGARGTAHS